MSNVLYYGDNLPVLRKWVADESVDLVYLDPPFNSKRMYNQIFKGSEAQAGIFKDYWEWDDAAEAAYREITGAGSHAPRGLVTLLEALYRVLERERDTLAYLSMMSLRLLELHRVLKSTGTLYLHCDTTASHYLKLVIDAIFGIANFRNEITWTRTVPKSDFRQGATNWPRVHDVLLYYAKDHTLAPFHQPLAPLSKDYIESHYSLRDPDGRRYQLTSLNAPGAGTRGHPKYELMGVTRYWRYSEEKMKELIAAGRIAQPSPGAVPRYKRYLDEMSGVPIGDEWNDIAPINSQAQERLGYPTQKPVALLERIVNASSSPGDLVLDPFCGCGTTIEACERLGRKWFGIDVAPEAVDIIRERMNKIGATIDVKGWPEDMRGAKRLAKDDKVGFQRWAVFKAGGRLPDGRQYKGGADGGVDGEILFRDGDRKLRAIISVKAGGIGVDDIRVLRQVVDDTRSQMGIFVTMQEPTKGMRDVARDGGFITGSDGRERRKIQILTIEQLIEKKQRPDLPGQNVTPDSARPGPRKGQTLALPFGKSEKPARRRSRG